MAKYKISITNAFKKNLKRIQKRGYNMALLDEVVTMLSNGETLPQKYRDHPLTGNLQGVRDCHISPDWLLIYCIYESDLILLLTRTGTHADILE